jgi:hypothetical protein
VVPDRPARTRSSRSSAPGAPGNSPFRLNLEQQRKRAKDLLHGLRAADPDALARVRKHHPSGTSLTDPAQMSRLARLSETQLVIARELGLPSWPKLKAHIQAMQQARDRISTGAVVPDGDVGTLHIRCGSDLLAPLGEAGFSGDFLEYSDALCQGPVIDDDDWLDHRAAFLARAYGVHIGQNAGQAGEKLRHAEGRLISAARLYERIVIWVEHDSYDQLVLARCLAQFAATVPRRLELISVERYPGDARFIGLGQLPPEALRLLWEERKPVSAEQLEAGRATWAMLRKDDPTQLAKAARSGLPELPQLARALRRHCQELPWLEDGLSLTERLVLQLLSEGPKTIGEAFSILMRDREPLPWLGDIMFLFILDNMKAAREPVFTGAAESGQRRWPNERLTITDLGRAVLARKVDWLSLSPPDRWLGGVRICPALPCWRWDEQAGMTAIR